MARNPNPLILDRRCRVAMATEFLFQNYDLVYNSLPFPVKHGYCLNPELINATDPRLWVTPVRREPLDENWYPFFRKMFRKFAKKWRSGSDGVGLRWSYDQLQWDWRSFHAQRLRDRGSYEKLLDKRAPLVPKRLTNSPKSYLVFYPSKIYSGSESQEQS
ncbi:unnamed protein product [Amoebophrya sp. A120]|nr:unnamed protein product [Amoebophrya sp. A120]|eukprot:GSA120T00025165001.1